MLRICVTAVWRSAAVEIFGLEDFGDEAERRERMPQVVDQHRDVVTALGIEHALQAEGLERGPDPGDELSRVDGLREVRVGAFLQARLDRVRLAARRGQHDDRRGRLRGARAAA